VRSHGSSKFEWNATAFVMDEILTGLSIEMIETVFVDLMDRLQRLVDGNGDGAS
jgi:hypothetical protein